VIVDRSTQQALVCGSLGERGNTTIEQLEFYASGLGADPIDVLVVWMRVAPKFATAIFTVLLTAICTVCMAPGLLQAIGVGYFWTYAYGGTSGVGFGGIAFWLGSYVGSSICYALGQTLFKSCFDERPPSTACGRLMTSMQDTPLQALSLLRLFPLVPYNVLNYYVGASYRFSFRQASIAYLCTLPLSFTWVGIGGAILKFRLVERGEISSEKYLPYIWTGIGCSIALVVVVIGGVGYKLYLKAGEPAVSPSTSTSKVADGKELTKAELTKAESVHLCTASDEVGGNVAFRGASLPAPPPPPRTAHSQLLPGWRELVSNEATRTTSTMRRVTLSGTRHYGRTRRHPSWTRRRRTHRRRKRRRRKRSLLRAAVTRQRGWRGTGPVLWRSKLAVSADGARQRAAPLRMFPVGRATRGRRTKGTRRTASGSALRVGAPLWW